MMSKLLVAVLMFAAFTSVAAELEENEYNLDGCNVTKPAVCPAPEPMCDWGMALWDGAADGGGGGYTIEVSGTSCNPPPTGIISSPNYPGYYTPNTAHWWEVEVPEDMKISVKFAAPFYVNYVEDNNRETFTFLVIYHGVDLTWVDDLPEGTCDFALFNDTQTDRVSLNLFGWDVPNDFITLGYNLAVNFCADNDDSAEAGFQLTWTAVSDENIK